MAVLNSDTFFQKGFLQFRKEHCEILGRKGEIFISRPYLILELQTLWGGSYLGCPPFKPQLITIIRWLPASHSVPNLDQKMTLVLPNQLINFPASIKVYGEVIRACIFRSHDKSLISKYIFFKCNMERN